MSFKDNKLAARRRMVTAAQRFSTSKGKTLVGWRCNHHLCKIIHTTKDFLASPVDFKCGCAADIDTFKPLYK